MKEGTCFEAGSVGVVDETQECTGESRTCRRHRRSEYARGVADERARLAKLEMLYREVLDENSAQRSALAQLAAERDELRAQVEAARSCAAEFADPDFGDLCHGARILAAMDKAEP